MIQIGDTVRNFGIKATVIGYKHNSLILEDGEGMRWIADPTKCEVIKEGLRHKSGVVAFG